MVPFHCLGCVWSQRDKKQNRSLAPSVRATIAQFNSVTNWVITSLLCTPTTPNSAPTSPKSSRSPRLHPCCHHTSPGHRARIIEKWISVAQVHALCVSVHLRALCVCMYAVCALCVCVQVMLNILVCVFVGVLSVEELLVSACDPVCSTVQCCVSPQKDLGYSQQVK